MNEAAISYDQKRIWHVSYPIFLGLLAQNIINVTDTAFLGRVGEVELGASAIGGLFYICLYTLAFGFSVGAQILIARRNGEGNFREVGPVLMQGILFSFLLAVILLLLSDLFMPPVIRMLLSSDTIYDATMAFLEWRIWGLLFSFVNVMFRALYIGITRTKVLTLQAAVMACVNVILDYGLIFGELGLPRMGLEGAALASVVSEAVSLLFFLAYTRFGTDRERFGLNRRFRLDLPLTGRILSISGFMMVQQFMPLATWFVFFVAIERLGQRELAIANIVRSIYILALIPIQALSTTSNTLVSNTMGAGHPEQVMPLMGRIARLCFYIILGYTAVMCIFPKMLLSIYTDDSGLIGASVGSVYMIAAALIIASFSNIYFNGISGTGNTRDALILETVVQVIYSAYIFWVGWWWKAPITICFTCEIVCYTLMLACSLVYLKKADWRHKRI